MIESIVYEKATGCLIVTPAKGVKTEAKAGIPVYDWLFVPNEGFYPVRQNAMVEKTRWCGTQISELLDKHLDVIQGLLKGEEIHAGKPLRLFYAVSFDKEWNLHIISYLHKIGDLEGARDFGHWIYLDGKGFYPVEERRFDQLDLKVPVDEVADFVRLQRGFLNHCEGFHTHLASIESFFTYRVTQERSIVFKKHMQVTDAEEKTLTRDFGPYVYIFGRGFYPKSTSQLISPVNEDLVIREDGVSNFLKAKQGRA